jgi:hypothetical protein
VLSDANTPGQKVQTVRVRPRGSVYRVNAVHVASSASCLVCLCLVVSGTSCSVEVAWGPESVGTPSSHSVESRNTSWNISMSAAYRRTPYFGGSGSIAAAVW